MSQECIGCHNKSIDKLDISKIKITWYEMYVAWALTIGIGCHMQRTISKFDKSSRIFSFFLNAIKDKYCNSFCNRFGN